MLQVEYGTKSELSLAVQQTQTSHSYDDSLFYQPDAQIQTTGYESPPVTCGLNSHLNRVTIPDAVLTKLSS